MIPDNRWEDTDKAALNRALLALRICPKCRGDLLPVAYTPETWGCAPCKETFHIPPQ